MKDDSGGAPPRAGWYRDPDGAGQRYWDGSWTDQVRDMPPPPTQGERAVESSAAGSSGGNALAVAAIAVSVVGAALGAVPILFAGAWGLGAVGLLLGILGRRKAARHPDVGRRKLATGAAIVGVLAIGLGCLGVAIVNDAFKDVDRAVAKAKPPSAEQATAEVEDTDADGMPDSEDPMPYSSANTEEDVAAEEEWDDTPSSEDPYEDLDDEPQAEQKFVSVGDAGVDDDVTFKVEAFDTVSSVPLDEFSDGPVTARSGAKLIKAVVTYKNNTSVPIDVFCGGGSIVLLDEEDRNFDPMDNYTDIPGNTVCGDEVQPGFKSTNTILFQIPDDSKSSALVLWNGESEEDSDGGMTQVVVTR